jgi:hypothetical protein
MDRDQEEDSPTSIGTLCENLDAYAYLPYFVLRQEEEEQLDASEGAQCPCTCDKESIAAHFKGQIAWAKHEIEGMFQGLCLDCMYNSLYGDGDYWRNGKDGHYDRGCSIRHHKLTWFFSYSGEPSMMSEFLEEGGFGVDAYNGLLPLTL